MYRKSISLLLVLALVGVVGAAVAMASGPTGDDTSPSSSSLAAASPGSDSAVSIYMTVYGRNGLPIEGSSTTSGHEGAIEVLGYSHEIVSPRDAASGLPTGKRQHKPITITKHVDKATPLLMNTLTNNENLPRVEMQFVRTAKSGKEEVYFTIVLTNASLAGFESERPFDDTGQPREHISFTYQKITWTWEDGGITAEDDWETPVS